MKQPTRKRDRKKEGANTGIPDASTDEFSLADVEMVDNDAPERRKRGRPKKSPPTEGAQSTGLGHSKEGAIRESSAPELENGAVEKVIGSPRLSARAVEDGGNICDPKKESVIRVVPSMDAVVKVFCVHTEPNFSLPWQRKRQYSSSSSGFVIGGRRVLTNAHSVEHYTQVKLKKRGSDTKYLATVLAIGTECDIAMLTVNDDEFWDGVSPVEFGSLPALQDAVTVVGYPIGGDTISVTSGVVSRMEILSYVHGATELLGLQIDAAINSGNSGGPAFNDKGHCVGIAFQSLKHEDVENIGYVIPTPVITHFIKDYEKSGEYTGFPILGIEWQKMENPDLRKAMGMTSNQKGVRVRRIEPTAPASRFLKPSDILLNFDGIDIANDGTAMLTVNDDEFWDGVSPVEFGSLPALQDAVTVVGYPIGGDTISVTSGVVSRMEILSYVHGATELLGLQIDAAINSGNSGGPAFNDKGHCVGIAFQSLKHEDVENIGYVIPTPVITHFIKDYEKSGEYTGFPILGIEWQKMENPDLRKAMGMTSNQKGVRVRRIEPTAPASRFLKPSDILLNFDGIDIANDGTVPFRHGERIGFSYLVSQKYTGESAAVKVLRQSQILEFNVEVATHKRLVAAHIKGKPPSYYIIAGFVFSAISVPYLRSEYGKDYDYDAPVKLLDKLLHSMAQTEDEQLVVVSQVLVSDINIGYEDIVNTQVLAFNKKPIKNLRQLAEMVENYDGEFLQFDLEYQQIVVLETKTAKAATLDILKTHCIPSAMSEDLRT